MKRMRSLSAAALLLFPLAASADPCAGVSPFSDVPTTAIYCTNTEWMKNRSITLGCTATMYCPGDAVSRASMALFMNRLGTALTPLAVSMVQNLGANPNISTDTHVCATAEVAAVPYPRQVHQTSNLSIQSAGQLYYRLVNVFSTDGGTTWQAPLAEQSTVMRGGSEVANWSNASSTITYDLQPNTAYVFALRYFRDNGAAISHTDGRCHVSVLVMNRNGTSSPFDALPPAIRDDLPPQ